MIQINNVSSPFGILDASPQTSSTDNASTESFESALSEAVTQTLQKFGINPNSVNISIAPSAADAGTSSNAASASTTSTSTTSISTTSISTAATGTTSSNPAASINSSSVTSNSASTSPAPQAAASDTQNAGNSTQSFDQAYWASQPAAVQALQNITDPNQRTELATQLANEGYTIDVPIMVWGWDPAQVMSLRESYGYTWVPSALQNSVELAPGISSPGLQPYDPNNPPTGSIAV